MLATIGIILTMVDRLSTPLRYLSKDATNNLNKIKNETDAISKSFETLQKKIQKAQEPFERLKDISNRIQEKSQGMLLRGTAGLLLSINPVVNAANLEQAMAEVSTLTDMSLEEFKQRYSSKILDISRKTGQDAILVTKAMYQAISAGIDPDKSIDFIEKAGKAAIAGVTDIFTSVDLATSIKNAFNTEDMNKVFDTIFKTVQKGKTTYSEIAGNFGQIAAVASSAGVSLEHIQTAVAQMTLSGVKTEQAYTSLKYAIESIIAPSDKAKKIFQELGLEINAETLRQQDLLGVMDILTEKIKGLDEVKQAEIISDIFGSMEAQVFVKDFISNKEKYRQMLSDIANSTGAAEEAYKKMASSSAQAYKEMMQTFKDISISLGATILPAVNEVLRAFKSIIEPVAKFAQEHQTLSKIIISSTIGFFALTAGIGLVGFTVSKLISSYIMLRTAINLLVPSIKSVIVALRALTATVLTNPILILITAISVAGYLLWKNWDNISRYTINIWNKLKSVAFSAFTGIKNIVYSFINWLKSNWKSISYFLQMINPFTRILHIVNIFTEKLFGINLFQVGKKLITTLTEGIKSVASKPIEVFKTVVQKIRNMLPFSPAKEGPLKDLNRIRLVETIAENITVKPLKEKMNNILHQVLEPIRASIQPLTQPVKQVLEPIRASIQPLTQPVKQVSINIEYKPVVNLTGSDRGAEESFSNLLKSHKKEIARIVQDVVNKNMRLEF